MIFLFFQIASYVFGFLSVHDLLVCRTVCKLWNFQSTFHIKKCKVTVTISESVRSIGDDDKDRHLSIVPARVNLIKFLKCVQTSQKMGLLPVDWLSFIRLRISLISDFVADNELRDDEKHILGNACKIIAKHITHLSIIKRREFRRICGEHRTASTVQLLRNGQVFKKLYTFEFKNEHIIGTSELPKFAKEIISKSPLIRNIHLYRVSPRVLFDCINAVINLTSLKWKMTCSYDTVDDNWIPKQARKLEVLHVDGEGCYNSIGRMMNLQSFIELQSTGLLHLTLTECNNVSLSNIKFPNLTVLVLKNSLHDFWGSEQGDSFPVLKKLELSGQMRLRRFLEYNGTLAAVTELIISDFDCAAYCRPGLLFSQLLFKKFPNLCSLEIPAATDNIVLLVGTIPSMHKLTLYTCPPCSCIARRKVIDLEDIFAMKQVLREDGNEDFFMSTIFQNNHLLTGTYTSAVIGKLQRQWKLQNIIITTVMWQERHEGISKICVLIIRPTCR